MNERIRQDRNSQRLASVISKTTKVHMNEGIRLDKLEVGSSKTEHAKAVARFNRPAYYGTDLETPIVRNKERYKDKKVNFGD